MRTLAVAVAAGFAALMLAGPVAAANSVDLIWSGSSDVLAVGVGTDTITVTAGDTLTLDVIVNIDTEGLSLFSFGIGYDSSIVTGIGFTECQGFVIPGTCVTSTFQTLSPAIAGVTINNVGAGSNMNSWDGIDGSPPFESIPQSLVVGTAVMVAGGASGTILTNYLPGLDGIADGLGNPTTFPSASANVVGVVPEPGTVGLLGLGLVALGVAGRRRN